MNSLNQCQKTKDRVLIIIPVPDKLIELTGLNPGGTLCRNEI